MLRSILKFSRMIDLFSLDYEIDRSFSGVKDAQALKVLEPNKKQQQKNQNETILLSNIDDMTVIGQMARYINKHFVMTYSG